MEASSRRSEGGEPLPWLPQGLGGRACGRLQARRMWGPWSFLQHAHSADPGLQDALQALERGEVLSQGNPGNGPGRGAPAGRANAPLISAFM